MARNRMLNPEFFLDEELATMSAYARLLYEGLWGICDDVNATLPNRPGWIKAQIFPYNDVNILELLSEIRQIKKIVLFKEKEEEFWFVKNFSKHQKVDHPSKQKYPVFIEKNAVLSDRSPNPREDSPNTQRGLALNRIESNRTELIPAPKTAGYMAKFKKPSKIFTSKQLLADTICRETSGELKIPKLMGLIRNKGEEQVRRSWAEVKADGAKNPVALFMYKLGKVKIAKI